MPKAYSYVRFSTPEQAHGDSFRRQQAQVEAYCARHGLELDTELTFTDLGRSAFRGKNVAHGALRDFQTAVGVGLVPAGSFLLVESLDRISRDYVMDAMNVLQSIVLAGITVVTLFDGREYDRDRMRQDPTAILLSVITFMRAHDESATKSKRVRAAWTAGREGGRTAGKVFTSNFPAWIRKSETTGALELIEERAAAVRRIFDLTLAGQGCAKVAQTLGREGFEPFGGRSFRRDYWSREYVRKILANPAAAGTLVPHTLEYDDATRRKARVAQEPIPGYYPAAVSLETFQRVQSMRSTSRPRGMQATAEVRNIFGGVTVCAACGASMTMKTAQGREYLVCTTAKRGGNCVYRALRYGPIRDAFLRDVEQLLSEGGSGGEELDVRLANIRAQQVGYDEAISRIVETLAEVGRSPALVAKLRQLESEREAVDAEEAETRTRIDEAAGPVIAKKVADLLEALAATPMDRGLVNALLRQTFRRIVIDTEGGTMMFEWKQGGEGFVQFDYGFKNEAKRGTGRREKRGS